MKIKTIEEKDPLAQQTQKMAAGKIFANNYIPEYVPEDLPWYERDSLMTHIDQLKYKEFISDPDVAKMHNVEVLLAHTLISFTKL